MKVLQAKIPLGSVIQRLKNGEQTLSLQRGVHGDSHLTNKHTGIVSFPVLSNNRPVGTAVTVASSKEHSLKFACI